MNAKERFIRDCKFDVARHPPAKACYYIYQGMNWFLTCCKYGSLETLQHLHQLFDDEGVDCVIEYEGKEYNGLTFAMMYDRMNIIEYLFEHNVLSIEFLNYSISKLGLLDIPCHIAVFRQLIGKLNKIYDSSFDLVKACLRRKQYDLFGFQDFDLPSKIMICKESLRYSSDNTLLVQLLNDHPTEQLLNLEHTNQTTLINLLTRMHETDLSVQTLSRFMEQKSKVFYKVYFETCLKHCNIKSAILFKDYVDINSTPWLILVCQGQINVSDLDYLITSIWKPGQIVSSSTNEYSWISCQNKDIIEYLLKHPIYRYLKVLFHDDTIRDWNTITSEILRMILQHDPKYVPEFPILKTILKICEYDLLSMLVSRITDEELKINLMKCCVSDPNAMQILIDHEYDISLINPTISVWELLDNDYPDELLIKMMECEAISYYDAVNALILFERYELLEYACQFILCLDSEILIKVIQRQDIIIYRILKAKFPNIHQEYVYNRSLIDYAILEYLEWNDILDELMKHTAPYSEIHHEVLEKPVYNKLCHANLIPSKIELNELLAYKNKNYIFSNLCANGHLSYIKKMVKESKRRK
jgi:hypothetical protein